MIILPVDNYLEFKMALLQLSLGIGVLGLLTFIGVPVNTAALPVLSQLQTAPWTPGKKQRAPFLFPESSGGSREILSLV